LIESSFSDDVTISWNRNRGIRTEDPKGIKEANVSKTLQQISTIMDTWH